MSGVTFSIPADFPFSVPAFKLLLSLVGEKLGRMEVVDRDDAQEQRRLETAKAELLALIGIKAPEGHGSSRGSRRNRRLSR